MNRYQIEAALLTTGILAIGALIGFGASQASGIDQPIIVQQTITSAPRTITVTTPGPTVTRTVKVTERASRSTAHQRRTINPELRVRPTGTWMALAKCESGATLRRNSGNGYYGAYQFSQSTWEGYGATRFAPTPLGASWAEQTYVAWRIWSKQGWAAFPGCGRKLGHPTMTKVSAP